MIYLLSFVGGPAPSTGSSTTTNPTLISERKIEVLAAKAHLIVRMIQLKVGNDLLLQVQCSSGVM